jgi:hypothetical protein
LGAVGWNLAGVTAGIPAAEENHHTLLFRLASWLQRHLDLGDGVGIKGADPAIGGQLRTVAAALIRGDQIGTSIEGGRGVALTIIGQAADDQIIGAVMVKLLGCMPGTSACLRTQIDAISDRLPTIRTAPEW